MRSGARLKHLISNILDIQKLEADSEVEVVILDGDPVRIEIRDRGPGVPAEFRPRLFHKFCKGDESSTRKTEGSGLGLAISRAIAVSHDGDLE